MYVFLKIKTFLWCIRCVIICIKLAYLINHIPIADSDIAVAVDMWNFLTKEVSNINIKGAKQKKVSIKAD